MAKFSIGDRVYASKKQAREAVQAVLYRYEPGQKITHPEDVALLSDLLQTHRKAKGKIGCGVSFFWIKDLGYTRCFWLTRIDGTETDWSFTTCISPKTHRQDVVAAFRAAISFQVVYFKEEVFQGGDVVCCEVTGEPVESGEAHVDHEIPFADLLEEFLGERVLSFEDIEVKPHSDGETENYLADRSLHIDWVWWHLEKAKLRIVTKQVNLSLNRRRT